MQTYEEEEEIFIVLPFDYMGRSSDLKDMQYTSGCDAFHCIFHNACSNIIIKYHICVIHTLTVASSLPQTLAEGRNKPPLMIA